MAVKSRSELLKFASRQFVEVDGVRLQSLTELEMSSLRSKWGLRYNKTKDVDLVMRRELLVATIVDEDGNRLFSDEEVDLLGDWNSAITEKLHIAARKICGMDEPSEVDETEKKSDTTTD